MPSSPEDDDWTAVTVARDGSWGVGSASSQSQAMAESIRNCKRMSASGSDCGARTTTIKSGWTLVLVCGEHRILVAAKTLHEAEAAALHREIELDLFYVRGLPPCRRALAIDPDSTITSAEVTSRR